MLIKRQLQARISLRITILYKSSKNKIFPEILGDYNGVSLKNIQRMEQKLEKSFFSNFFIFWDLHGIKNYFWSFI